MRSLMRLYKQSHALLLQARWGQAGLARGSKKAYDAGAAWI